MSDKLERIRERARELMSENHCTNDFVFSDGTVDRERICEFAANFALSELSAAEKAARKEEREQCASIADNYGPNRPLSTAASHSILCVGRWEGEQAASKNIATSIRNRE